jgi:ComF family protein
VPWSRLTKVFKVLRPGSWALGSACAVCRAEALHRLCDDCLRRFAAPTSRCEVCARHTPSGQRRCGRCTTHPPPLDGTCAAVDYTHPWDGLITRLKFNDGLDLLADLSQLMHLALARDHAARCDWALPVPLSPRRLAERGYNQSWELARRLAPTWAERADARLLLRVRDTPHQLGLKRSERETNVRGAFAVDPLRAGELSGGSVLLVDDVMTSGATAFEIARTLRQAGAARIHLAVLARTPLGD